MSKEWLEEMENMLSNYYENIDDPFASTDNAISIIEKVGSILNYAKEQSERVQELTKLVNYHKEQQKKAEDKNEPYRHQNKRYREVIEKALAECVKDKLFTAENILAKALEQSE